MFSFLPQALIIISLAGIIVIVFRKMPGGVSEAPLFVSRKIKEGFLWVIKKFWDFLLEVKELSRVRGWPHLPALTKKFPRFHIPLRRPHLHLFRRADSPEFYVAEALKSLEEAEDYEEAERKFIKALKLAPKNEQAYTGLGRLYLIQKKFEEAVETYKFLIKHYPENDAYFANLAQAYHGLKLYDQAVEFYEKAIELAPQNPKRYLNLGLTLEAKKHLEEAILNYRKALDLEKDNTQFMLVLAEALISRGEKEEGQLLLEQILLLEPTNHLAREKLMGLKF